MNAAIPSDTFIPLKIAATPTGIPRRTLYRWAATGRLRYVIIDGERCATIRDMIELDETRRHNRQAKNGVAL